MKTIIGQQSPSTPIQNAEKDIQADPLSIAAIAGVILLGIAQMLPSILAGWAKSKQEQSSVEIERERGENRSRETIVQTLISTNQTFTATLLQSVRQDREEFLGSLHAQQELIDKMQERADA